MDSVDVAVELKQLDRKISKLIKNDKILSGLEKSSDERIQQLIDAETGRQIRVSLIRHDGERLDVIVPPDATVRQLRRSVELATRDHLNRSTGFGSLKPVISWRRFWRLHDLVAHDVRLDEADTLIREYNITSGTILSFSKRFRRSLKQSTSSGRPSRPPAEQCDGMACRSYPAKGVRR